MAVVAAKTGSLGSAGSLRFLGYVVTVVTVCLAALVVWILARGATEGYDGYDGGPVPPPSAATTALPPAGALVARSLRDFEEADDSRVWTRGKGSEIVNITHQGDGLFQFLLRHRGQWYDGDRDGENNAKGLNKSRAEVNGLKGMERGQVYGETWEYGTSVCFAKDFVPSRGWCNIVQVFPVAWINLTGLSGDEITGGLYHTGSDTDFVQTGPVRTFTVKRGEWLTFSVRAKVHKTAGELLMSVNGDAYRGKRNFRLYSDKRPDFGGKWGLYISTESVERKPMKDALMWHRNIWMRRVDPPPPRAATPPAPTRPASSLPCGPRSASPNNTRERAMHAELNGKLQAVKVLMRTKFPNHPYTKRLADRIDSVAIVDPKQPAWWGLTDLAHKCVAVRILDDFKPAKTYQTNKGRLNAILFHELAHVIQDEVPQPNAREMHGQSFLAAARFLYQLATESGLFPVDLLCGGACKGQNLCKLSDCPKCTWLQDQATCPQFRRPG